MSTAETQLWAIACKGDRTKAELKRAVSEGDMLATVYDFKIPKEALRVGTLDSLMSLSDDLAKMDILAEATVTKLYKQLKDLSDSDEEPTIIGVPADMFTTSRWEWDEAKFQLKTPLRELCEGISQRISSLDDELKLKVTEVNNVKGSLQVYERKTQGNLMVRGLADIIKEEDVMETDYMTTVYVVVPKNSMKDFESSYEKMAQYVVPKSGTLLQEDSEYGLYTVILFKKSLEDFKANAREKRLALREFTYKAGAQEEESRKKAADQDEMNKLKSMLANWCHINYAEVYTMMLHLKAVRIFVESVLRYGLAPSSYGRDMNPNFKAFLLQPVKGKTELLRKALSSLYSAGGAGAMMEGEEESVVPGATGEFYPYVYTSIETAPAIVA